MPRRVAADPEREKLPPSCVGFDPLRSSGTIGAFLLLRPALCRDAVGHHPCPQAEDGPVARRSQTLPSDSLAKSPKRFGFFDFPVFLSPPRGARISNAVPKAP